MKGLSELILLAKAVVALFVLSLILFFTAFLLHTHPDFFNSQNKSAVAEEKKIQLWQAPDLASVPDEGEGKLIHYGHELITHTSSFIGPNGSLSLKANGMNCQNCHLNAGTKPYGNNFGSVASTYPKFRSRSGQVEGIEKRVNDCIMRSLNGAPFDSVSHEMRAIVAYISWLGKDVPKGEQAPGSGMHELKWMTRAANIKTGKKLYLQKCQICHGYSGEGQKLTEKSNYLYPPVNGDHSFSTAAGLNRISNFAKYIYANMPYGATFEKPALSEEQSWDIAAYVLSLPRPKIEFKKDWPVLKNKPLDHPFGPYADSFSDEQHRVGPFAPIEKFYKETK